LNYRHGTKGSKQIITGVAINRQAGR